MWEFIQNCLEPVNLPFTLLLGLVLLYWLLVIFGAVGMDLLNIDIDTDLDLDMDVDAEFDADTNVGPDGPTSSSVTMGILRFFHFGEMPLMVIASIFIFSMWFVTYMTNYYFNAEKAAGVALLAFGPNLLLSLVMVKVLSWPFAGLFRQLNDANAARQKIVGQICLITTGEVTVKFGQAQIAQDGPPLTLNVRVRKEDTDRLHKGDAARVVAFNKEDNTYVVVPNTEN